MEASTKRTIIRFCLSLVVSLVVGAIIRTTYESLKLPDLKINTDYYVINGLVSDLISSLFGIMSWEGSIYLMKKKQCLYHPDVQLIGEDSPTFPEPDSGFNFKSFLGSLAASCLGASVGSLVRAIYETFEGPDVDIDLDPLVLHGLAAGTFSTIAAITVYEYERVYEKVIQPSVRQCRLHGFGRVLSSNQPDTDPTKTTPTDKDRKCCYWFFKSRDGENAKLLQSNHSNQKNFP